MNTRQKFNETLRAMSLEGIQVIGAMIRRDYNRAKRRGDCTLEAVLYFDLEQVKQEQKRRTA